MRDAAIVARVGAGTSHKDTAQEFEVSESTVRLVLQRFREARSPMDERPLDVVEDLLKAHRQMNADLLALAWRWADSNPSACVAALKQANASQERVVGLLGALGVLPRDLHTFRDHADIARLGKLMLDRLTQLADGRISAEECRRSVFELVAQRQLEPDGMPPADPLPPLLCRNGR